jgi:hypothetical protein
MPSSPGKSSSNGNSNGNTNQWRWWLKPPPPRKHYPSNPAPPRPKPQPRYAPGMIPGENRPIGCPWWNGLPCLMQHLNQGTVGLCFGGSLALIVADGAETCFAYDQYGAFIEDTRMKPGQAWGLGLGLAGGLQVSNARSKNDLAGPFTYAGRSFGDGDVSLDGTYSWGGRTKVIDGAASVGASTGGVGGTSFTAVTPYYFTWCDTWLGMCNKQF